MPNTPNPWDSVPVVTTKHLVRSQPPEIPFTYAKRHYVTFEIDQNVWELPEDEFLRVIDVELGLGTRDIREHLINTYKAGREEIKND